MVNVSCLRQELEGNIDHTDKCSRSDFSQTPETWYRQRSHAFWAKFCGKVVPQSFAAKFAAKFCRVVLLRRLRQSFTAKYVVKNVAKFL